MSSPLQRPATWQDRIRRHGPWLLLAAFWLAGLGRAPLFDLDEGAFAEASREMLSSGDWGHTTLDGLDRFDKPIFIYWWQASAMAIWGPDTFAARLPSALAGIAWCVLAAAFARRHLAMPAGRATQVAWLFASSLGVMVIGRAATADAMLNVCLVAALYMMWAHLGSGDRAPLRWAFVAMGVGALTKGPVALLIPLGTAALYALTDGGWRRAWRLGTDLPSWALLLGLASPWYLYALHRHGWAFVEGFVLKHNLGRYTAAMEHHGGHALYGVLSLIALLLPWSALIGVVATHLRSVWREPVERFLLIWALFVLVFFSLSQTKLPHYFLYGLTPWLLLGARHGWRDAGPRWLLTTLAATQALLLGLTLLASPIAHHLATRTQAEEFRTLLAQAPAPSATWLAAATGLAWVVCWLWRRQGQWHPQPIWGAAVLAAWLVSAFLPWWGAMQQGPVRELARLAARHPHAVVQDGLHMPSFAFYQGRATPQRAPMPNELALVRTARRSPLPEGWAWCAQRGPYALVWAAPADTRPAWCDAPEGLAHAVPSAKAPLPGAANMGLARP
jgi:4-amino-4-deoxy-L-arabinose transferase-like glycosyltransferase